TARSGPQRDRVLEEPEPLLGVTAVVEAVRPEIEHLTGRGSAAGTVRARRARIPHREAVPQVVLVLQPAGIRRRPVGDVPGVFGTAAGADARGPVRFRDPRPRARVVRV